MIRDPKDNSLRNFPADMLVVSGLPLVGTILVMSWALWWTMEYPRATVITSLAAALLGAGSLCYAKLPLYRDGTYYSFGPQAIPASRRAFYYWGLGLALGGCALTALLIPLLRLLSS